MPGVGPVTAMQIILSTNEFMNINDPKKFASYAGVAPFIRASGLKYQKAMVSKHANKRMKTLLHMCALAAIRSDADMENYYRRKTSGEGKPKLVVINAVRYKLISRIFACVKKERPYEHRPPVLEEMSGDHQ